MKALHPQTIRDEIQRMALTVLGRSFPPNVRIIVARRSVTLIGPRATGKTRVAQAFLASKRHDLRIYTGTHDDVQEEFAPYQIKPAAKI